MPDSTQRMSLRVYYEDTDFTGRVYHASYLRFFERGRTEWLRAFGFRHNALVEASQITFAVTKIQVEFVAAAFIDDLLEIVTELQPARGPVLSFQQTVAREGAALAKGAVEIVAIRGNRAVRPPREILAALTRVARP